MQEPIPYKRKWFFDAQHEAGKVLDEMFEHCPCNYQQVTKDRVIEGYTGFKKDGGEPQAIEVHILKRGSKVVFLIFEMKLIASN